MVSHGRPMFGVDFNIFPDEDLRAVIDKIVFLSQKKSAAPVIGTSPRAGEDVEINPPAGIRDRIVLNPAALDDQNLIFGNRHPHLVLVLFPLDPAGNALKVEDRISGKRVAPGSREALPSLTGKRGGVNGGRTSFWAAREASGAPRASERERRAAVETRRFFRVFSSCLLSVGVR